MQGLVWGEHNVEHEYGFDVENIELGSMQHGGMQLVSLLFTLFVGNLVD